MESISGWKLQLLRSDGWVTTMGYSWTCVAVMFPTMFWATSPPAFQGSLKRSGWYLHVCSGRANVTISVAMSCLWPPSCQPSRLELSHNANIVNKGVEVARVYPHRAARSCQWFCVKSPDTLSGVRGQDHSEAEGDEGQLRRHSCVQGALRQTWQLG
eukprot:2165381-Amphidinium_carterae.1